jgi:sugar lactone lactonase YvrE
MRKIQALATVALLTLVFGSLSAAAVPLPVITLTETLDGGVGGVTVDALGFVYVADFGEVVWKISPFGEVEVFVDTLYGTSGNAIDSQGRLLQSSFNAGTVSRVARDGTVTQLAQGLQGPVGINLDATDNAFVCECRSNSLSKITPEGEVSKFAESDLFNCPNGITRDGDGNLYVVNFSDGRMLQVTPEGAVREFAVIPGGGNGHIARVGNHFYVTGFRSNKLYRVSAEGEVTTVVGDGRFQAVDGDGVAASFASPNGIAYDPRRDALYINDYLTPFPQRARSPRRSTVRQILFPTLTEAFNAALAEDGLDAAVAAYQAYKASRPGRFTQIEVNVLGYTFLQQGKVQEAIRIFTLNTEAYPNAFNPWDSLAEAYKAAGDRENAIRYYRKSLELNPANTNATAMLKELGVE